MIPHAVLPVNRVNSEHPETMLFGPNSSSEISQTFPVNNFPFDLTAFGLTEKDLITVYQVSGGGSGVYSAPFAPVNGPVTLSANRTKVRITYPGQYALHYNGNSLGTFVVLGAESIAQPENLIDAVVALIEAFKKC